MSGYDPRDHYKSRRVYVLGERRRNAAGLIRELEELSAEVDKAAAALDRPGGRAIRKRLVSAMRCVIEWHRMVGKHQAELDELTGVGREPAQVIEFPKARITQLRVVGESTALRARPARFGRREAVHTEGGDHAA